MHRSLIYMFVYCRFLTFAQVLFLLLPYLLRLLLPPLPLINSTTPHVRSNRRLSRFSPPVLCKLLNTFVYLTNHNLCERRGTGFPCGLQIRELGMNSTWSGFDSHRLSPSEPDLKNAFSFDTFTHTQRKRPMNVSQLTRFMHRRATHGGTIRTASTRFLL